MSTGLAVAVPPGTYGRVAPRSGLAFKHFIDTGAGVIDEDYRGELKVLLFNHSESDFKGGWQALLHSSDSDSALQGLSSTMHQRMTVLLPMAQLQLPPAALHNERLEGILTTSIWYTSQLPCGQRCFLLSVLAVNKGDRVAQLILERIYTPEVQELQELPDTVRGAGGFGSTGVSKQ